LFSIVAVPFEDYAALPSPAHRWLMTCLARYADRAGCCWPSMRQLAVDARMSVATVCRRLAELAQRGVFQRERLPGGGRYRYTLAEPYRLRWPERVSPVQNRVSRAGTPEQARPAKHGERERFANRGVSYGELPDERVKWEARLRSWRQSRFWLPLWGPKPGEPGCFAPREVLQAAG
jgi:hypothetical protein